MDGPFDTWWEETPAETRLAARRNFERKAIETMAVLAEAFGEIADVASEASAKLNRIAAEHQPPGGTDA